MTRSWNKQDMHRFETLDLPFGFSFLKFFGRFVGFGVCSLPEGDWKDGQIHQGFVS